MSGSDYVTTAYLSKDSSFQTLSTQYTDGLNATRRNTPDTAGTRVNSLSNDTVKPPSSAEPARAAAVAASARNMNTTHASYGELMLNPSVATDDRLFGEVSTSTVVEPDACGSPSREGQEAAAADPSETTVVDRNELSLADMSQIRLDGCRTHHRSFGSSHHDIVAPVGITASLDSAGYNAARINRSGGYPGNADKDAANISARSLANGRPAPRVSVPGTPSVSALDTSLAILQRMAIDTAARLEATSRQTRSISGTPSSASLLFAAAAPSVVGAGTQKGGSTGAKTTSVPSMPVGICPVLVEAATDPIGFLMDAEFDHPVSLLHTDSTNQFRPSSTSTSPLHSLSESELCGTKLRPLGMPYQAPVQLSGCLAADSGTAAAGVCADASGPSGANNVLSHANSESPDDARRRLYLVGISSASNAAHRQAAGAAEVVGVTVNSSNTPGTPHHQHTRDVSVYNHDFQQIIPHEVKEALTRNMRPSIDDDEDEGEALLHEALSCHTSPGTQSMSRQSQARKKPGESHNCAFAPFQMPSINATSIDQLDSVFGSTQLNGNRPRRSVSHLDPAALGRQLNFAGASGEGAAAAAREPLSRDNDSAAAAAAASGNSSHHLSSSASIALSAQAWRFPSLGKEAPPSSAAASGPRRTLQSDKDAENTTTTTNTTKDTKSSSRHTHRPARAHSNDSGSQMPHMPSSSGSWRRPPQPQPSKATFREHENAWIDTPHGATPSSPSAQCKRDGDMPCGTTPAAAAAFTDRADGSPVLPPDGQRSQRGNGTSGSGSGMRHGESHLHSASAATLSALAKNNSISSLPGGNGGGGSVQDEDYARRLDMVYTVYERLCQQPRHSSTVASNNTAMSTSASNAPAASATVSAATSRVAKEALQKKSDSAMIPLPHPRQSGMQCPLGGERAAAAVGTGTTRTSSSSAVSSRARCSPSMSCSGALGHSAGYYSFGHRVSLSHPNRQTLPHQYLGSSCTLHGSPSPRTVVLGSPAVLDLAASSGGAAGGTVTTHPLLNGVTGRSVGPENSLTLANAPSQRLARGSLNSVLLRRIESRPLLQTTLFLQQNLRVIRDSRNRDTGGPTRKLDGGQKEEARSHQLHEFRFPVDLTTPTKSGGVAAAGETAAAPPAATARSSSDRRTSIVTPQSSSNLNTSSDEREVNHSNTRGPSSALPYPPLSEQTMMRASERNSHSTADTGSLSDAAAGAAEAESEKEAAAARYGERARKQTFAAATTAENGEPSTPVYTTATAAELVPDDVTESAHRYHRALTEANERVRHLHGVDGVEREVDNESLDLIVYVGMRLLGWLEVVSLLGCGSFGQVFLCKDLRICDGHFVHPSEIGGVDYEYWNCSHAFLPFSSVDTVPTNPPLVAVKVVKSVPLLEQQSMLEAEMLVLIGAQTAPAPGISGSEATTLESVNAPPPEDPRCATVAKVLADGICYGHHCIVMERYGANLYEYIASNEHLGLPMYQIRSIGRQLFTALSLIHEECHIIHADIKPENMLLTLDSCRGTVRTSEAPGATPAQLNTSVPAAAAPASNHIITSARATSPPMEQPPHHQQRTEQPLSASVSMSLERSYIKLRTGPVAAAGRHRHDQSSRRTVSNALDASVSMASQMKGHSFRNLLSSSTSQMTVLQQTDLPTPEPRRVQTLNQSAGMLSSTPVLGPQAAPKLPYRSLVPSSQFPISTAARPAPPPPQIPRLRVKLIDFSSSCYDAGPFYQYIQSRYYRAPEVIVGASYDTSIDIWSSGCLMAELLLGMPLLPGCNDHHQLCLIEEMVGPLPAHMIHEGLNAEMYYTPALATERDGPGGSPSAMNGSPSVCMPLPPSPRESPAPGGGGGAVAVPPVPAARSYKLRSREDYLQIAQGEPLPYRRYFTYQTLQELVRHCPLTLEERRMSNGLQPYVPANESSDIPANAVQSPSVRSEMMKQRFLLFDLLRRLLQTDAKLRPTAAEALRHPFFVSTPPYMKTFTLD